MGAGLFGLLTGNGFFGGIGGFFSIIGFLLQIALLAVLARFAYNWWQTRNLAPAGARPRPTMAAFAGGAGFGAGAARALIEAARQASPDGIRLDVNAA